MAKCERNVNSTARRELEPGVPRRCPTQLPRNRQRWVELITHNELSRREKPEPAGSSDPLPRLLGVSADPVDSDAWPLNN